MVNFLSLPLTQEQWAAIVLRSGTQSPATGQAECPRGDLFYNQLPGWPMALYTTSALCVTLSDLYWPGAGLVPSSQLPEQWAFCALSICFVPSPTPPGCDSTRHFTVFYRVTSISVELCPLVRAYSHWGGTTTKGHIFTELYCPTAPVSGHSDHRRQDEGCCHPNSHKSEF